MACNLVSSFSAAKRSTAGELVLKGQHLNEKVDELSFLHNATDRLRLSIELEDVLTSVARDVTQGIGYERVLVALVNEDANTLDEKVSLGFDGKERELLSEGLEDGGIFSDAVHGRKAQYVANAALDSRVPAGLVESLNLNEFAIIPMAGKDRCVGVLIIDNRKSQKPMRKDKLDIVSTFASTAAKAGSISLAIAVKGEYGVRGCLIPSRTAEDLMRARKPDSGALAGHPRSSVSSCVSARTMATRFCWTTERATSTVARLTVSPMS